MYSHKNGGHIFHYIPLNFKYSLNFTIFMTRCKSSSMKMFNKSRNVLIRRQGQYLSQHLGFLVTFLGYVWLGLL